MTDKEELKRELSKLHEMLSDVGQLDSDTNQALSEIKADIDHVLAGSQPPPESYESLHDRIRDLMLSFETKHPRLTGILAKITDTLAGMGI